MVQQEVQGDKEVSDVDWDKVKLMPKNEKTLFIANQILMSIGKFSDFLKQKGIPNRIRIQVGVEVDDSSG
jgi:hypothetical protein